MKTKLAYIVVAFLLVTCTQDPDINDVFYDFRASQDEILADGQSTIPISVRLSNKASADRRKVIFSTTGGVFTGSDSNKHTAEAKFENGALIARTILRAPIQPGSIDIIVEPEFDSPIAEFALTKSLQAKPSIPNSIKIKPASTGIASNFINEVQLIGILSNSLGNNVSKGNQVVFEDFLQSGATANGRFRNTQDLSNDTSQVSTYYSTANHPIGTTILVKATVLDINKIKLNITDSITLTVNQ